MPRKHQRPRAQSGPKTSPVGATTATQAVAAQDEPIQEHTARRGISSWRAAYLALPPLVAALTSLNTLWNEFASDDLQQVLGNALIKSFGNLPRAFTVSGWAFSSNDIRFAADAYYRPMLNVLFTINYGLFGPVAWGWHLTNLLIHSAAAVLVFVVLNEMTGRRWVALITALLFAAHPVHVESVAWISGVTDPMLAVFVLLAFYFYLKFRRSNRIQWIAIAGAFYLLALMCKETALALPLIIIYCELVHFNEDSPLKRRITLARTPLLAFAFPLVVYFFLRYVALGTPWLSGDSINPLDYGLRTTPLALVKYLKLLLIPFGYSFQHYTTLVGSLARPAFIVPVLIIAVVAAAIWLSKSRLLRFAAMWFAIWVAPSLAVLRQYDPESLIQERYLYLASIGFCLALALGIEWLSQRKLFGAPGSRAAAVVTVAIVLLWSVVSIRQNRVWRDSLTLYENCVAVEPDSPAARAALALAYSEAGRFREADEQARKGLELDSQFLGGYLSLGYRLDRLGQVDQAIKTLQDATTSVAEGPLNRCKLATVYLNLGRLYEEKKQYDFAEQHFVRSIEMWPRPVGWYYTGLNYYYQERYDEALRMYQEVIRHVPPNYAPIHLSIGAVYESLNRLDEARTEYYRYLELAPAEAPDRQLVEQKLRRLQPSSTPK